MESPYYEMTHDFEEENRLFQSGYVKGYHDAVMRCPDIVRCKDCIFGEQINDRYICTNVGHCQSKSNEPDWFCADGVPNET